MNPHPVVTAAGVISPLGAGLEKFACALFAGRTAIAPSTRFPGIAAAEIAGFDAEPWLGKKGIRMLDRSSRLLASAARMALDGPAFPVQGSGPGAELGLVCGTLFGSVHSIAAFDWSGLADGVNLVSPMEFPNTVINAPAGQAAIRHGLSGVNSTICAGLASGLYAFHYAAGFVARGRAQALLAGGVDELCEESVLGFRKAGLISPTGRARPFAADRDGVVPGEGAALCIVETEESALQAGRVPWMEIRGFGGALDTEPFRHGGRGAVYAIDQALSGSAIEPGQIACIIAFAGGSRHGDAMEERALKRVFGKHLAHIPVCAPKAAFGEAMGASGALSVLVAGLSLREQRIPPPCGSGAAAPIAGEYALVNAFGCDGYNAALVVRICAN